MKFLMNLVNTKPRFFLLFQSTGDSLDEEEADKLTGETKRNTSYNEVIDADNPQTPEEVKLLKCWQPSLSITI